MSFFGSLTGSTQRKDIRAAQAQANQYLDTGYNKSQGYYDQAAGLFDTYAQQGQQGGNFYNSLMGLNGADARSQAQATITSDPLWSGKFAQDSNAMLANMNARGDGAGGNALVAGQRVLFDNYSNMLDRYRDMGRQGFEATGAQAGIRTGQGDNAYGYGATKAANALNTGNAIAGTRGIGVNNLMGLLGTGLKAYTAGMGGKF